jgi:hypothetical protein
MTSEEKNAYSVEGEDDGSQNVVLADGEIVQEHISVDEIIDQLETIQSMERDCRARKAALIAWLAAKSPQTDGCRTTRVRGERRRVKLEYPDDAWDQGQLKEAWHAYPQFRDEFLAIGSLKVKLREYKKLAHERGAEPYEAFKSMLAAANRGPQGQPKVTVEE